MSRHRNHGIVVFAVFFFTSPASATAFCEVKRTSDGFVALRAGPGASAARIWRLKPGEMVQLDRTRPSPAGWRAVIYRSEDGKIERIGWVSARLIEQECG